MILRVILQLHKKLKEGRDNVVIRSLGVKFEHLVDELSITKQGREERKAEPKPAAVQKNTAASIFDDFFGGA